MMNQSSAFYECFCFVSCPSEATVTRLRLSQPTEPLSRRGIKLHLYLCPFLDNRQFRGFYISIAWQVTFRLAPPILFRRVKDIVFADRYDLCFVQREAVFFGSEIFELLVAAAGRLTVVLDLNDETCVSYVNSQFGYLAIAFKLFGEMDRLIKISTAVIGCNRFIAGYAAVLGAKKEVMLTVADKNTFSPVERNNDPPITPIIGWIGVHSTFTPLEHIFPVLERLGERYRFRLRIVRASHKLSIKSKLGCRSASIHRG